MSSAPAATNPSSAFTPEGDTTLALASLVPFSSDGPTLPLIGNVSEHASSNGGKQAKERTEETNTRPGPGIDYAELKRPWMFLPPELRSMVPRRFGGAGDAAQWWDAQCVPVVYTRNQNIKSGVNRLKALLGCEKGSVQVPDVGDAGIIAVSAQGEATTKLVGVVEIVRRVVAGLDGAGTESGARGAESVKWYMYTSLASRVVREEKKEDSKTRGDPGKSGENVRGGGDGGWEHGEDEGFEVRGDGAEGAQGSGRRRKVPVLTVWMSRRRIEEFQREFGSQDFEVAKVHMRGD